jgi:ABC-type lipoprotein export system ATPase subunit/GNAT superfamily N-acetyltransferase
MKIKLETNIINDEYTQYIYDTFDIQDQSKTEVVIEYNLNTLNEFDWNIGVIIGSSGSGKTTILRQLGELIEPTFDNTKALISNFDFLPPDEATRLLSSMGLASVPTWLRPYDKLSNGEQYRARLSYLVGKSNDIILIDEYTSVVDRDVAKAMSFALQKYIRKTNKKIIVASCHYDILEWLMPDWTCSPQKRGVVERHDYLRQGRPQISLQVSRCESKTYDLFKEHHYMSKAVNKAYKFVLFEWNSKPIAIGVIGIQMSKSFGNAFRESRIVVLPDYQGLGIGTSISNFMGGISKNINYRYYTKTIHPALGEYRNIQTDVWKSTAFNGKVRDGRKVNYRWKILVLRKSYCHEYIGDSIDGYDDLLRPIHVMRDLTQMKLF